MELTDFLGLRANLALRLCLPEFTCLPSGALPASTHAGTYTYPGTLYADRDVRSANHIVDLAREAGAEVNFVSPNRVAGDFQTERSHATLFIFGSKSNHALPAITAGSRLIELVKFNFGASWTIRTRTNKVYSLPNPSTMSKEAYASSVDYGVIAALRDSEAGNIFLLSGLGGRATEGCGLFLRRKWATLAEKSGGHSFAALLRFSAPVDPKRSKLIEFVTLD